MPVELQKKDYSNAQRTDGVRGFRVGNPGGPGHPNLGRVQRLRKALSKAVKLKDIEDIVAALVAEAKGGNVAAAKELFDRVFGKPATQVELTGDAKMTFEFAIQALEGGSLPVIDAQAIPQLPEKTVAALLEAADDPA